MALNLSNPADRLRRHRYGGGNGWFAGWLAVLLTVLIAGVACWAILTLQRAADRTQQAQVTLAEIQRNAQNAENLFSEGPPAPSPLRVNAGVPPPPPRPPSGQPPGAFEPPPPGGFSAASLQVDNVALLNALRAAVGDRREVDAVSRELMKLNGALGPLAGPPGRNAGHLHGERVVVALQRALQRLSATVAGQRSHTKEFSDDGTLVIALIAALLMAIMLRRVDRRRRAEAEKHAQELRSQALRDPLTGLANRRQLAGDLAASARKAKPERPLRLMLFDLDGFKDYNDTFGHHEGDLLLSRLARSLGEAVAPFGRAYRLGGDEFCALLFTDEDGERVESSLLSSLASAGEGFSIQASVGSVLIPTETSDPETAMQWADKRMYASKDSGRLSAGQQTRNIALHLLAAQEPEVFKHSERVASLAGAVGARMGISAQALSELTRAAELHDIGKVAIPFAILEKAGSLDEEEWELMRRHPVIGANILNAAPALTGVAAIVRSSHERFDGRGYPDGLVGDEIPLASRIVFACDCFDAITSDRAYRPGAAGERAIAELKRCAGTQFDPAVIDVLERCWSEAAPQAVVDADMAEDTPRRRPAPLRVATRELPAH